MVDRKFKLPDIVSGYEIFEGLISFTRPSTYAVNLIKNPRMWSMTGYSGLGDTDVIQTHDEQYRGLFSLYCSGSTGVYNGVGYEIALAGDQKYKFSADVKGQSNQPVYFYLDVTGAQTPATATIIQTEILSGRWQRISWEFVPPVNGTYSVIIATDNDIPFHTDGWMLFSSNDVSGEPETYFDGDTESFTLSADFSWSGGRDTSYSVRRSGSGASGKEIFLSDLGFIVQGTVGLGKNPVNNIATALPTGGGYYQDTIPSIRQISLAGKVFDESRLGFMNVRRNLIDLFKPDRTPKKQPMLMRVYNLDSRKRVITPVLEAHVVYSSGLEGSYVSDYSEMMQLKFIQYDQNIIEEKDTAEEVLTSLVESEGVDYLRADGEIDDIPLPSDEDLDVYIINAIEQSRTGEIYAGGKILDSSATSKRHIIRYDGSKWERIDEGYGDSINDSVYAIKEFETKYIAIGGNDISSKPLKVYNRVSGSMTSYPTEDPNGAIYALEERSGTLFVGGNFTVPNGYLATYSIGEAGAIVIAENENIITTESGDVIIINDSWGEIDGNYPNGTVRCLLLSRDETKLFVGGDFTQVGSESHNRIVYYDFEDEEWVAMGSGLGDSVYGIAEGLDGTIYACGKFTTIQSGAVYATYIARFKWQDTEWTPLENEYNWRSYASSTLDSINAVAVDKDGGLYLGGTRTTPTTYANLPKTSIFKYANQTIISPLHFLTGSVHALKAMPGGGIYIGSTNPSNYLSSTVDGFSRVINLDYANVENATSYPEFHIRGPGTLFAIENHTTKQRILFDHLSLYRGDRLIVKIDPIMGLSLEGVDNAVSYLSAGSDTSLSLTTGINNISVSFEPQYEFLGLPVEQAFFPLGMLLMINQIIGTPSYATELSGFTVGGLNAENTNNGALFYISHTYDAGTGDITVRFLDYNSAILAEGTSITPHGAYVILVEMNSSGVSGSVWVEGDTASYQTEIAVGLVSVVWKNRRWSISDESE